MAFEAGIDGRHEIQERSEEQQAEAESVVRLRWLWLCVE